MITKSIRYAVLFAILWATNVCAEYKQVPIRIESMDYIKTNLYLKYEYINYQSQIDQFRQNIKEEYEKNFYDILNSIQNKNYEKAMSMANVEIREDRNGEEKFKYEFDKYNSMISKLEEKSPLIVDSQVLAGKTKIFLWGINQKIENTTISYRRAFKFKLINNSMKWDTYHDPVMSLLCTVSQKHAEEPNGYSSKNDGTFKYKIPLYDGNDILLCFNGFKSNFDIFKDDTENKVLKFYKESQNLFVVSPKDKFADLYTEKSREKYLKWINGMNEKEFVAYHSDFVSKGKIVTFLIDIDPVYIVFYRYKTEDPNTVFIHYDYIYDVPGKGLKLTNFYYFDTLDNLMNTNEFRITMSEKTKEN